MDLSAGYVAGALIHCFERALLTASPREETRSWVYVGQVALYGCT
jgi:hypothetical protein